MRPFDPRLLRTASAARGYLIGTVLSGLLTTGLVLAQAGLLAHVIVHADRGANALRGSLLALGVVLLGRTVTAYAAEAAALRAAARVQSQLRRALLHRVVELGPEWLSSHSPGQLSVLLTRGLDALEPYLARYLPQLVLACTVPLAVVLRIAGVDLPSAIVLAVTLPLIPVFMILVGMHTRSRTERQWQLLSQLGGHFLDIVQGLPTLKVFGRAKAQAEVIARVTEEHRHATMRTLRVAFLSALVLELLSTLSVAVIAVELGLRLLAGAIPYEAALLVLLLAPEAYLPLRQVGLQFHASAEGVAAAAEALDLLESVSSAPTGGTRAVDAGQAELTLRDICVERPGRTEPVLNGLSVTFLPGEYTAIVGVSGAGKTTVLNLLLGLTPATSGGVTLGGIPLDEVDLRNWRDQVAWVPQRPHLIDGTLADNVRLGRPDATDQEVLDALALAGATFGPDLLHRPVGERGQLLSSGQRQRIAIARAFLRDAQVLLLDEPAAHLDAVGDGDLRAALARFRVGRTVIVVTHSLPWAAAADRVLELRDGKLHELTQELAA